MGEPSDYAMGTARHLLVPFVRDGTERDEAILAVAHLVDHYERRRSEALAEGRRLERERLYKIVRSSDPPTREPRKPTGGMQTGDILTVGLRDWYARERLVRAIRQPTPETGEGE